MARRLVERYVLGDEIGAGGTSRVHAALDERLGRRVAVKLLDASLVASADPAGRERFVNEGRTTAGFHHRHAVTVFDAGEDEGDLFIVMELVEGESLAERLARRGPLPIPEVVAIAGPLISVLSAAHIAGIVHRDVKPANVLLADGVEGSGVDIVKLADFGIAKRFDDLEGSVTATGMVIGTPRYLAPEQAVGKPVSPATDVYALGTVMFEMLTGRPPVEADSVVAAAMAQQSQPAPDVRSLRPEVPAALADLVARALERAPGDRFPSATEMATALDAALSSGAVARGVGSSEASVPTQVLAPVAPPSAAVGRRAGDTQVLPTDLPPPPVSATDVDDRDGTESSGRVGVALVFVLALVLGVVAVAVATGRGDRADLVTPGSLAPASSPAPVTDPPVTDPPVTDPPVTDPPVTDPPVTDPPVTEPPVAEIIPGFPATDDLGVFLEQLERDPDLAGEEGDDLAEDLREVLEARGGRQRNEARELREELEEWVDEGEIDPAIAAALDALLAPLADR